MKKFIEKWYSKSRYDQTEILVALGVLVLGIVALCLLV